MFFLREETDPQPPSALFFRQEEFFRALVLSDFDVS